MQQGCTTVSEVPVPEVRKAGKQDLRPYLHLGNTVTKTIPDYLRIHRGAKTKPTRVVPPHDSVRRFWDAYSDVTGWRIDQRAASRSEALELLPAVNTETAEMQMSVGVSKIAAARLAESAARLAEELQRNREVLRRQEIELASRAPILATDCARDRLADRIDKILADAASACRCQAAAMYLLDEETKVLKARAVFGLPLQRLEEPARHLRGSRADLQAMVDEVVAINDLRDAAAETWNSPEPFASAICASVESDDIPIGTLWLFSDEKRSFARAEPALAKFAASQLALELAHAAVDSRAELKDLRTPIRDLAQWQYESLPVGACVAPGWRVDGLIESPHDWATGWHVWDVLPDGTLMIAIAEAVDGSAKGAMNAAIARAALAAHTGYRHSAQQLIQRVSDTLWQTSTAEQLMSLMYARIQPDTGEGELVCAGSITAMVASRYGYRPLLDGGGEPLNTSLDARASFKTFRLLKGETFMAYTRGFASDCETQLMLGSSLRSAMQEGDVSPLARVRRAMAHTELDRERGAITLLRE